LSLLQLATAQEDLDAKEMALNQANQRITDLEKDNLEMKHRLELVIEGNGLKAMSSEDEDKARRTYEATIDALRQRAQFAERDVAVLGGLVSAMKQMLISQWQEQGSHSPLHEKTQVLLQNQSVWESETVAARERANSLERQLQGKDETIRALRAQLGDRK
jgi:cupin superfamily acireductone dioxygenase involved in methionine salvage